MSSDQSKENPPVTRFPIGIDFGGPLGRAAGDNPPPPRNQKPNLPEPPGDWSKQQPPPYPSLF